MGGSKGRRMGANEPASREDAAVVNCYDRAPSSDLGGPSLFLCTTPVTLGHQFPLDADAWLSLVNAVRPPYRPG